MLKFKVMEECLICERVELAREKKNKYLIKELETGFAVLGDFQYYRGYTLFLSKIHAKELHELDYEFMRKFLEEMAKVAKAVYQACHPDKLNYEMLGNGDPHLHWHIFPRYQNDPKFKSPIWIVDKSIRYSESVRPSEEELVELNAAILKYF
jgi:diadenosine tetraphosphate (Ap4A) HIT family hydrolase